MKNYWTDGYKIENCLVFGNHDNTKLTVFADCEHFLVSWDKDLDCSFVEWINRRNGVNLLHLENAHYKAITGALKYWAERLVDSEHHKKITQDLYDLENCLGLDEESISNIINHYTSGYEK